MTKSNQSTAKKITDHLVSVATACLLMMWGVVNLVFNFLTFRQMDPKLMPDGNTMLIAVFFVVVTGLIPFLLGLFWLWKLMGKPASVGSKNR